MEPTPDGRDPCASADDRWLDCVEALDEDPAEAMEQSEAESYADAADDHPLQGGWPLQGDGDAPAAEVVRQGGSAARRRRPRISRQHLLELLEGRSALRPGAGGAGGRADAASAAAQGLLPLRVLVLRDKLSFALGQTLLWCCAFWLGSSPATFHQLWTGVSVLLLGVRVVLYRRRKWHYMLLDLCYACNLMVLAHAWVWPASPCLARAAFAFNAGPLTTSVLAFRNSLVPHDIDKVTSLFMHLAPACLSWALRWHAAGGAAARRFGDAYAGPAGLRELVGLPLGLYAAWACVHYLTIFGIAAERIKRKGSVTLYTYCTTRRRGAFAAISRRVPPRAQPLVYLLLHLTFCTASLVVAWACWRWRALHTAQLLAVVSLAIFNGAGVYVDAAAGLATAERGGGTPADTVPASPTSASVGGRGKHIG